MTFLIYSDERPGNIGAATSSGNANYITNRGIHLAACFGVRVKLPWQANYY